MINVTGTIEETLSGQMNYPSFPVRLKDMGRRSPSMTSRGRADRPAGRRPREQRAAEPSVRLAGFRIEHGGRAVVYATDTEHYSITDPSWRSWPRAPTC